MSGHHKPLLSRQPCLTDPQQCRADPSSTIVIVADNLVQKAPILFFDLKMFFTNSTKPRKRKNRPGGGSGVGMLTPHDGYQFQGKPQFRSIFGGGRVNRKDKVRLEMYFSMYLNKRLFKG